MKQFTGCSLNGDVNEAIQGLENPKAIIVMAGQGVFDKAIKEVSRKFPNAELIGCVGQSYAGSTVNLEGVTVVAFCGNILVQGGVIEHVGDMPLASIHAIRNAMQKVEAQSHNTFCIDLTCGNDAALVTTLNIALSSQDISLVGGTAWEDTVSYQKNIYHDAAVFLFVKNLDGTVKTYKENLYSANENARRFSASKVDPQNCIIYELDGKPVDMVYMQSLGITEDKVATQTFENPLGRWIGNEIYLISIEERVENHGLKCYKKVNPMDILSIMQLQNYPVIIQNTIHQIQSDFPQISGIFSINCLFRYLLFEDKGFTQTYFNAMAELASHGGLIGLGEHYNTQHINQTMTCVVFD